jgi:RNA 2',3'-cyclic 3'-phosphodiesterase
MRMFVAVVPPEGVVEDLEEFLAPRREAERLRWTLPEHWHVTLAFLEDVPDRALDELVEGLGRAAEKRSPMTMSLAGGGAFPHVGKAKVLWAGVDTDHEELARAAMGARSAAAHAGVEVDGERFRPHVTLARMNRPIEATRWVRVLDSYRGPSWTVDELSLVASYLGEGPRGKPRYEVVETVSLGRAGSG